MEEPAQKLPRLTSPGWAGGTANRIIPLGRPRSRDVVAVVVINVMVVVVIVAQTCTIRNHLLPAPETWR
jgi:hypothetical protein